jgi:ribose 1,5-bisphosphokinase PhnN
MMFGAARIIGNVLSQAPSPEHMEVGKRYITREINQGMADHIRVAEARGSA